MTDINVGLQSFMVFVRIMSWRFPPRCCGQISTRCLWSFLGHPGLAVTPHSDGKLWLLAIAGSLRSTHRCMYSLCFTGRAAAKPLCEICFSLAQAQECPTAANDLDVASGWRMVKSVVAAISSNTPDQRPHLTTGYPTKKNLTRIL